MSEVTWNTPANTAGSTAAPPQVVEVRKAALRLRRLLRVSGTSLAGISPEASLELAEIIAAGYSRKLIGPKA
jgi:hypothetical protein